MGECTHHRWEAFTTETKTFGHRRWIRCARCRLSDYIDSRYPIDDDPREAGERWLSMMARDYKPW